VRYTTSTPIPVPRKTITPAPPATPKPRDLEEMRTNYLKKINELFDTLSERFQHLDMSVLLTFIFNYGMTCFELGPMQHLNLKELHLRVRRKLMLISMRSNKL
jgi:hypothetical protein